MAVARTLLCLTLVCHAASESDSTCSDLDSGDDPLSCSDAHDVDVRLLQSSLHLHAQESVRKAESASGKAGMKELKDQTSLAQLGASAGPAQLEALEENSSAQAVASARLGEHQLHDQNLSKLESVESQDANLSSGSALDGQLTTLADAGGSVAAGVGSPACPCIGIGGRNGSVIANISGQAVPYPIDVGSSCDRWDYNRDFHCSNNRAPLLDPAWCIQKWCFVDPCNCNLDTVPKISAYFSQAEMQDKQVYYSYEACGEQDLFTSKMHTEACVNAKTSTECFQLDSCSWSLTKGCVGKELSGSVCAANHLSNAMQWGQSSCSCIGMNGTVGWAEASIIEGSTVVAKANYSSNVGAVCGAWDLGVHPSCKGSNPPAWCKQKWCFVDPCKCGGLEAPPKLSTYFPEASYFGHPIYYSYATCGGTDSYTASVNADSCVNMKDKESCHAQGSKCRWTIMDQRFVCLGSALATLCNGAALPQQESGATRLAGSSPVVFLLLSLAAIVMASGSPGVP